MVAVTDDNQSVSLNFKGGGSFIDLPPIFSTEGESVFVSWRNLILEYSTKTGKLIHEYKLSSNRVVGFSYHTYDTFNCVSACTENGTVILWKAITHYKIVEKVLPIKKIKSFSVISSQNNELKALVSYVKKFQIKFAVVNLKKNVYKDFKLKLKNTQYHISISENYFSVVCENYVYFLKFDEPDNLSKYSINQSRQFTCIACHPTEEIVLTGDTSGRIVVWQNIFVTQKTQNVFHWHTLPVRTVSFSTSGTYFYSGGSECVLVKWQLDNANERKFVPRLPSDIHHITVANNNVLLAVATEDNAIRIFDNMLNHTTLIQHFVLGQHYECGITYDPRTRSLIMNGSQGYIQFYSPEEMSLLYSVDVIGQNKITNERECKMINTEITKLALSKSGRWLASIEERRDSQYQNEVRLKFWHFSETNQMFELNSSIEYPHDKSITSVMFQPALKDDNLHCVTLGEDNKFKVWKLEKITTVYKKDMMWKCHGVGFFRNLPCYALSICVDGSLMAISFGSIVTTWVPETCELKCTLVHPIHKDVIRHVQFGYGDQCHLLVSASKNQLAVWNLLTLSMMWTVPVSVRLLIADPFSTSMAVFTDDKKVFVFSPGSSVLIYNQKHNFKAISSAAFVPTRRNNDTRLKWYERSNIYFISSEKELYSLGNSDNISEVAEQFDDVLSFNNNTYKVDAIEPIKPITHLYKHDEKDEALKKYLASPIHTMVPITLACQSLLRSFVVQKQM